MLCVFIRNDPLWVSNKFNPSVNYLKPRLRYHRWNSGNRLISGGKGSGRSSVPTAFAGLSMRVSQWIITLGCPDTSVRLNKLAFAEGFNLYN